GGYRAAQFLARGARSAGAVAVLAEPELADLEREPAAAELPLVGKRPQQRQLPLVERIVRDQYLVEGGGRMDSFQIVQRAQHVEALDQLAALEAVIVDEADQLKPRAIVQEAARGGLAQLA